MCEDNKGTRIYKMECLFLFYVTFSFFLHFFLLLYLRFVILKCQLLLLLFTYYPLFYIYKYVFFFGREEIYKMKKDASSSTFLVVKKLIRTSRSSHIKFAIFLILYTYIFLSSFNHHDSYSFVFIIYLFYRSSVEIVGRFSHSILLYSSLCMLSDVVIYETFFRPYTHTRYVMFSNKQQERPILLYPVNHVIWHLLYWWFSVIRWQRFSDAICKFCHDVNDCHLTLKDHGNWIKKRKKIYIYI